MRRSWGIVEGLVAMVGSEEKAGVERLMVGGGLVTPPASPEFLPLGGGGGGAAAVEELARTAVLYVGRM